MNVEKRSEVMIFRKQSCSSSFIEFPIETRQRSKTQLTDKSNGSQTTHSLDKKLRRRQLPRCDQHQSRQFLKGTHSVRKLSARSTTFFHRPRCDRCTECH